MSAWAEQVRAVYDGALPGAATVHDDGYGMLAVDVPVEAWPDAVRLARDDLALVFFDWLSAVDELDDGFRLVCHLVAHRPGQVRHLLVQTRLSRGPESASVADLFAGAAWHEREAHEMFGIGFTRDGEILDLEPLLLPDGFEGHPLRKDFVLASRVAKPWPGAKDPGESQENRTASRRRARPPGVPDPQHWGPAASAPDDGDG